MLGPWALAAAAAPPTLRLSWPPNGPIGLWLRVPEEGFEAGDRPVGRRVWATCERDADGARAGILVHPGAAAEDVPRWVTCGAARVRVRVVPAPPRPPAPAPTTRAEAEAALVPAPEAAEPWLRAHLAEIDVAGAWTWVDAVGRAPEPPPDAVALAEGWAAGARARGAGAEADWVVLAARSLGGRWATPLGEAGPWCADVAAALDPAAFADPAWLGRHRARLCQAAAACGVTRADVSRAHPPPPPPAVLADGAVDPEDLAALSASDLRDLRAVPGDGPLADALRDRLAAEVAALRRAGDPADVAVAARMFRLAGREAALRAGVPWPPPVPGAPVADPPDACFPLVWVSAR